MSNNYSSSVTSDNEIHRSFRTSYGSGQSTQATEVSECINSASQSHNAAAEELLFQNVGYGVGQSGVAAGNATTPFRNNYGVPAAYSTTIGYIQRSEERSVYEAPWSGLPLLHQFDPYPGVQRPSASRSGQLKYPVYTVYDVQNSAMPSAPSGNSSWVPQQSIGMFSFDPTQQSAASQQYTTSSSAQGGKMAIPKLPSSRRSRDTASNDAKPKPRYPCQVPGCITAPLSSDDLRRHVSTRHSQGPFWACNVCGHWEFHARRDKMWDHCRKIHNHDPAQGQYPCRSVESVGAQDHVAKVSTNGKLTRRRKRRLA